MTLNPKLSKDTTGIWWLQWTSDPNAVAYEIVTPAGVHVQAGKRATSAKLGQPTEPFDMPLISAAYPTTWEVPPNPFSDEPPPPPPPSVGTIPKYGFSPGHGSKVWSDSDHAWVMTKMREIAQGHPMLWRTETSSATDARCDRDVNAALANGLVPYVIIGGTNRTPSSSCGSYVAQVAQKYKGKGVIYTGPNEPDINGWTPDVLANHCKAIYQAIKGVDPDALVGYGAMWKGTPNAFGPYNSFVTSAINIAKGYLDFFPTHCGYDDPTITSSSAAVWNFWHWLFKRYGTMPAGQTTEERFAAAGIDVPFVCDEGWGKNPYPEAITKMNRILGESKAGRIHTMTIYCVMPDVPGYNYLLNTNRTETQGFQAYKQFMASV